MTGCKEGKGHGNVVVVVVVLWKRRTFIRATDGVVQKSGVVDVIVCNRLRVRTATLLLSSVLKRPEIILTESFLSSILLLLFYIAFNIIRQQAVNFKRNGRAIVHSRLVWTVVKLIDK